MESVDSTEILEIVNATDSGPIWGINWVVGNMGRFYLRVEGPEEGWTIWIRQ